MEAFSDGVFAIAITLLVLEIHVPEPGPATSATSWPRQWPSYAAYVVSFLTIGIIWINHHAMVRRLRLVDHSILIWNLVLLMTVSVLPFTTALVAGLSQGERGRGPRRRGLQRLPSGDVAGLHRDATATSSCTAPASSPNRSTSRPGAGPSDSR